jgi:uncharacterized protein YdeI (YjbR/CyaY-like superfamily)
VREEIQVHLETRQQWRAWLEENAATSQSILLVTWRRPTGRPAPSYEDIVEEALCFGWIDGQGKSRDGESSLQRMTPRGPKSPWSARNVGHVARLEAEGRMTDAGWAAVNAAKEDGRWDKAYDGQATAEVPADLAAAIAAVPAAQAMFDVLTKTNRFALIYRTNSVKQAATRERKIAGFVEMLARGEAPYPQKKRPAGT